MIRFGFALGSEQHLTENHWGDKSQQKADATVWVISLWKMLKTGTFIVIWIWSIINDFVPQQYKEDVLWWKCCSFNNGAEMSVLSPPLQWKRRRTSTLTWSHKEWMMTPSVNTGELYSAEESRSAKVCRGKWLFFFYLLEMHCVVAILI